jgi:hypothetical protein
LDALFDTDFEAMQPYLQEVADELDVTLEVVIDHMRETARRIAEIGEAAYEHELAAEWGCTVEEVRDGSYAARADAEWKAWKEQDRARRAQVVYWRGGNPPVPYRNGEPISDGSVTWNGGR